MKRTSEQRAKAKANAKPSQQKHMHILHTQNALKSIAKKIYKAGGTPAEEIQGEVLS